MHQPTLRSRIACTLIALSGASLVNAGNRDCLSCGVSESSGLIVAGAMSTVVGSGVLIVESVKAVGEGTIIVLKGASDAARVSIRISGDVLQGASVVVGASVTQVATASGNLLILSGKAIAFIPNEVGKALLHQTRVQ